LCVSTNAAYEIAENARWMRCFPDRAPCRN